jgi:putative transferase (TIGR04331 family)
MYQPMGAQNLNLIEQTIQFALKVQNLTVEISYYPHDYGWNVRKRFTDAGVEIDEKPMDDGNYQLHVCNYLGTSWLETIAANLPTICFYNPEIYKFGDSARPYISNLEKVGILHQSPQSAADKVMEVSENPKKWWQSDDLQSTVSNFRQKYARLEDS